VSGFKVVRRISDGAAICSGPNTDQYDPAVAPGYALSVELTEPILLVPTTDQRAAAFVDATDRLQFEVLFDHENRVRVLELKAQITRAQFRQALIDRCKQLNP
jgi:hypothetical protein